MSWGGAYSRGTFVLHPYLAPLTQYIGTVFTNPQTLINLLQIRIVKCSVLESDYTGHYGYISVTISKQFSATNIMSFYRTCSKVEQV